MCIRDQIDEKRRIKYLLLSSSLLVERVFLYTKLIDTLKETGDVSIWATSAENDQNLPVWNHTDVAVEKFPKIKPFREFPYNFMRRLNEFVWDFRFPMPSRTSMRKHVRNKKQNLIVRALKIPAKILAALRLEKLLENQVEKLLLSFPRSEEAEKRLLELKPDVIVCTGPFQYEQPAIFAAAKKLGIPTLAYIPSWDNITTKNRMLFKYDGYIVWSEQTKKELHEVYPYTKNQPVYVVGAPQYDIFKRERFYQTREEFCGQQALDPKLPVVVYAIGSPNFLKEHHGAIALAERVSCGELGNTQLLVRPHPIHDNAELREEFDKFAPQVRLQKTANAGRRLEERTQDNAQIIEWVNTFRHADVVVNLSSTVSIDAAIFDRPVVNLDFDPQPGQKDQELIKDINHKWNHFQPIAESGGVWLVNNLDETVHAVKTYLKNPNFHRSKRQWITKYVCGFLDGKCGERMAQAVDQFAKEACAKNTVSETTEIGYKLHAHSESF
jgi:CDP-Glycerol:Poly(glycerophosphate) glycerophosphotransferase